jgi:hypothetical protein
VIWYVGMVVLSLFAGVGVKWLVDRIWPPYGVVLKPPEPEPPPEPPLRTPAARELVFEDTMDVLGAGYAAGQQSRVWADAQPPRRHLSPRPEVPLEAYEPPMPASAEQLPAGGGM